MQLGSDLLDQLEEFLNEHYTDEVVGLVKKGWSIERPLIKTGREELWKKDRQKKDLLVEIV